MLEHYGKTKRTHSCGTLQKENAGEVVTLAGWVNSVRDHGSVLFVHLRDRDGITQVVFNEEKDAKLLSRAKQARSEYVIAVTGRCVLRDKKNFNPNMKTGE